eukprot:gene8455-biopygen7625
MAVGTYHVFCEQRHTPRPGGGVLGPPHQQQRRRRRHAGLTLAMQQRPQIATKTPPNEMPIVFAFCTCPFPPPSSEERGCLQGNRSLLAVQC